MNFIKKKYYTWKLNKMQDKIDQEFKNEGLTDNVLKKQIEVNKKRHSLNIADNKTLNDDGWAQ